MVTTTEVGQLAGECTSWIETLKSFKQQFTNHKSLLQQHSAEQTNHDVLLEVEHLHNQFHIQLINIHDLKQAVKRHMQEISYERARNNGVMSDDVLARHEHLYDEFQRLEATLNIISREFDRFVKYIGAR
ncbi:MAG: hypothetical protein JNK79_09100 [Chitinophagaceae bacterium]|nr:hypothetical protein [Chitinophagaceae bacterium]